MAQPVLRPIIDVRLSSVEASAIFNCDWYYSTAAKNCENAEIRVLGKLKKDSIILGMVQFHMSKGNTFQGSSMTTNTHNSLLEQELRRTRQFGWFRKVLPCSEPCIILANSTKFYLTAKLLRVIIKVERVGL